MVFVVEQHHHHPDVDDLVRDEPIPGTSTWQAHSRFSSGSRSIKDKSPQLQQPTHYATSGSSGESSKFQYQRPQQPPHRPQRRPQLQQQQLPQITHYPPQITAGSTPRTTTNAAAPRRRSTTNRQSSKEKQQRLRIPSEIVFCPDGYNGSSSGDDYEPSEQLESEHPQEDFYESCSSISSCSTDHTERGQAPGKRTQKQQARSNASPPMQQVRLLPKHTKQPPALMNDESLHVTDEGIVPTTSRRKTSWDSQMKPSSAHLQQSQSTFPTEPIGESWSTFAGNPPDLSFATTIASVSSHQCASLHRNPPSPTLPPLPPTRCADEEEERRQPPRKPLSSERSRRRIMDGLEQRHQQPQATTPTCPPLTPPMRRRLRHDQPPTRVNHYDTSHSNSPRSYYTTSSMSSSSSPNHRANMTYSPTPVEISPGHYVPLRTSAETRHAIARDFYTPVTCVGCAQSIFCISDAEFVLCPHCTVISAVHSHDNSNHHHHQDNNDNDSLTSRHGVGLGFTLECLFREQCAILAQRQKAQRQTRGHSPPPPSIAESKNRWCA